MAKTKNESSTSKVQPLRFPQKLWMIVNESPTDALTWSPDGKSILLRYSLFRKEFMNTKKYFFKTDNISSFVRQLNLYGFRKIYDHTSKTTYKTSSDLHEFSNPFFQRERPDLLDGVARKVPILKDRNDFSLFESLDASENVVKFKIQKCKEISVSQPEEEKSEYKENSNADIKSGLINSPSNCHSPIETENNIKPEDESVTNDSDNIPVIEIDDTPLDEVKEELPTKPNQEKVAIQTTLEYDMRQIAIKTKPNPFAENIGNKAKPEPLVENVANKTKPKSFVENAANKTKPEPFAENAANTSKPEPDIETSTINIESDVENVATHTKPDVENAAIKTPLESVWQPKLTITTRKKSVCVPYKPRRRYKPRNKSKLYIKKPKQQLATFKYPELYRHLMMDFAEVDDSSFLRHTSPDVMWSSTMPFEESQEYRDLKDTYLRLNAKNQGSDSRFLYNTYLPNRNRADK